MEPPRVRVIWPSGRVEKWTNVPVDRYTTLTEGRGR
ncbi:MAG: ASPIC/UnbV domain-containing protein [Acidobacteria bacterium]|nr:ASPIC/UnbV domain-containing protein [Acidobacteriota bacterium]